MNLTLDFGNTSTKAGIFSGRKLIHVEAQRNLSKRKILSLLKEFQIENVISSSVVNHSDRIERFLRAETSYIKLHPNTSLPIRNLYQSPKTLGMDRLADVVGAHALFPRKNVLVISAGTCITYDAVTAKGDYYGGNITPGLDMRLKSMHTFTARLPLVKKNFTASLFGRDTKTSMLTGIIKGTQLEMNGFIHAYKKKYRSLNVVITGGDAGFFDGHLECKIFAVPHLVLHGLNEILLMNASQKI